MVLVLGVHDVNLCQPCATFEGAIGIRRGAVLEPFLASARPIGSPETAETPQELHTTQCWSWISAFAHIAQKAQPSTFVFCGWFCFGHTAHPPKIALSAARDLVVRRGFLLCEASRISSSQTNSFSVMGVP